MKPLRTQSIDYMYIESFKCKQHVRTNIFTQNKLCHSPKTPTGKRTLFLSFFTYIVLFNFRILIFTHGITSRSAMVFFSAHDNNKNGDDNGGCLWRRRYGVRSPIRKISKTCAEKKLRSATLINDQTKESAHYC